MTRQVAVLLSVLLCRPLGAGELPQLVSQSPTLVTSNTEGSWDSQTFLYDGAGNIIGIGSDVYTYDSLGRIKRAGVSSSGMTTTESHEYDAFGNLYQREVNGSAGLSTLPVPVDWQTNQLEGAQYDGAGNLTYHDAAHRYEWDPVRMISSRNDGQDVYIYTATDERIAVKSGETWKWSLRDVSGKVIREMESTEPTGNWRWVEDFVHRDGQVVGAERVAAAGGRRHMHLDHLGTPRLLTDAAGQAISRHDYLPFGIELTSNHQERDRGNARENKLRFTGHERDFVGGTANDNVDTLDYMHGRYYRSELGRFLSVDPDQWYTKQNGTDQEKREFEINLRLPQGWNRYSYAYNNPIRYTDPDGRVVLVDDAAIGLIILGTIAVGAMHTYLQSPNADNPSRTNAEVMGSQIQSALTGLMSPITQAQNNRQTSKVANGLIAAALTELGKVNSAGGPGKDPDFNHHKKEIKAMLDRAVEVAKRLPKKAQDEMMRRIREVGGGVGLIY